MTHYSDNPGMVRVDFFRPETATWYMTEAVDMTNFYNMNDPYTAVLEALYKSRHGVGVEERWIIVVMEPYHKHAYPVMITPGRASYTPWVTG